jgi:hypothetical protein
MFIGRKQRYATMKEYLIEHLHRELVEDFLDLDWSKLMITLGGGPSQASGTAEIIFTPSTSTLPPHPGPGLTAASSFPQPGAVTPATTAAEPHDVVQAGTSPPLVHDGVSSSNAAGIVSL